jgi:type IV secretory pathway VirB2 component (pilin)
MPHPVFKMIRPALRTRLWCCLLLLAGLPARAQTPLGQPSLDESKVQIWCATARFVYDDAGRPNLKRTLRCDGSLPALVASLRPDSLRVYSVLYAPIEGKGRIYKGLKDNPTRLAALTKAIISKLKSSPARQRDPTRLARLEGLEKKLNDYVQTGLPPGNGRDEEAPSADTVAHATNGPAEAAEAAAGNAQPDRTTTSAPAESLLNRLFGPLALILSILSLVLFGLLRASMARELRQMRRMTSLASELSPAQQRQVEELVARRVDETLRGRDGGVSSTTEPASSAS